MSAIISSPFSGVSNNSTLQGSAEVTLPAFLKVFERSFRYPIATGNKSLFARSHASVGIHASNDDFATGNVNWLFCFFNGSSPALSYYATLQPSPVSAEFSDAELYGCPSWDCDAPKSFDDLVEECHTAYSYLLASAGFECDSDVESVVSAVLNRDTNNTTPETGSQVFEKCQVASEKPIAFPILRFAALAAASDSGSDCDTDYDTEYDSEYDCWENYTSIRAARRQKAALARGRCYRITKKVSFFSARA